MNWDKAVVVHILSLYKSIRKAANPQDPASYADQYWRSNRWNNRTRVWKVSLWSRTKLLRMYWKICLILKFIFLNKFTCPWCIFPVMFVEQKAKRMETKLLYEKYGTYMRNMDRGGLKVPNDRCCQWIFFCYIMFETLKDSTCRKSLSKIFHLVSETCDFGMTEKQVRRLCNIFFKNICLFSSHHSGKEGVLKVLKLSK